VEIGTGTCNRVYMIVGESPEPDSIIDLTDAFPAIELESCAETETEPEHLRSYSFSFSCEIGFYDKLAILTNIRRFDKNIKLIGGTK